MNSRHTGLDAAEQDSGAATPKYEPEMDAMRCILYAHGGTFRRSRVFVCA